MDAPLYSLDIENPLALQDIATPPIVSALESGKVIYFPSYSFIVQKDEQALLSESILLKGYKNISYDYTHKRLAGVDSKGLSSSIPELMPAFMHRFAEFAKQLIDVSLPPYKAHLLWGRTSYRPAEIKGRTTSKRKDDKRLHVDAFPSTPVNGLRILRVFCNINPYHEPRAWHLGESFDTVLSQFSPRIPAFSLIKARCLKWIRATKYLRSPYDHYMLQLHDRMKLDDRYQLELKKHVVDFPSNSTWIVFTDQVSHAALSGQFLLEQTFYLPVSAMVNPALSPLKKWEHLKGYALC